MFMFFRKSSVVFRCRKTINCLSQFRYLSFKSLRPFYLAVHPDLFNGFPSEQKTNEESLKVLHSYLNGLENRQPVYSTSLAFFKKDKDKLGKDVVSYIRVRLSAKSISSVVRDILKACDLPHHALEEEMSSKYRGWQDSLAMFGDEKELYASYMGNLNIGVFDSTPKLTLENWIDEHQKIVVDNQTNAMHIRLRINEVLTDLKSRHGIVGLSTGNIQYSLSMVYGGLKQVRKMLDRYFAECSVLNGRVIRFGDFNGLDQLGRMLFHINDIPSDWKLAVSSVPDSARLLDEIKALEMLLMRRCCGLKFIRPRGYQSVPVQMYLKGLEKVSVYLVKGLVDEDLRLKDVLAVCDWEDDFVGTSPEGYVKVPIQVSRNVLLSFIDRNLTDIKNTRKDYLSNLKRQQDAMRSCKLKFGLDSLEKDLAINTSQAIDACSKLETCDAAATMRNWNVVLSRYYSVSADGLVRIPWDFEREDSF